MCHTVDRERVYISIHALLAESDEQAQGLKIPAHGISIHALLAESDLLTLIIGFSERVFLSTLSLRRATCLPGFCRITAEFLSTLSLRRATGSGPARLASGSYFYPRSPCGERPWAVFLSCNYPVISIHALLAESDSSMTHTQKFSAYFYPRSPCGERHNPMGGDEKSFNFYPRSPCGERQYDTTN